jgi:hypothetical protein
MQRAVSYEYDAAIPALAVFLLIWVPALSARAGAKIGVRLIEVRHCGSVAKAVALFVLEIQRQVIDRLAPLGKDFSRGAGPIPLLSRGTRPSRRTRTVGCSARSRPRQVAWSPTRRHSGCRRGRRAGLRSDALGGAVPGRRSLARTPPGGARSQGPARAQSRSVTACLRPLCR